MAAKAEHPQATSVVTIKGQKRWDLIGEDFIAQNLSRAKDDPPYTLKDCANAWGISYTLIRQMSSKHKWAVKLKERIETLRLATQERLQDVALFDELEIRTRQATYARMASSLAYKKLAGLDDKAIAKMSIKDAVELLKLGLGEERQALGIGESMRLSNPNGNGQPALSDGQVFAVARRVLEMRRTSDGTYVEQRPSPPE